MVGEPHYRLAADAEDGAPMGAVPFGGRLSLRDWGDEWVVFNGESGHCHLLSPACGALVDALGQSPAGGLGHRDLFERAFGNEGAPDPDELAAFDAALKQLQALGLVRVQA